MTIWNRYTAIYDRLWVQHVSLGPTRKAVLAALSRLYEPGAQLRVMDMSCGTGQLLSDLASAMPNTQRLGIEPSKLGEVAVQKGHAVRVETIDDMIARPLIQNSSKDHAYDLITCTHAFPYYPDQPRAILALSAQLKPGGHLLLAHAETATAYDWLALAIVKLTTSRAHYPSPRTTQALLAQPGAKLQVLERIRVNGRAIPSITLYIARKTE